MYTLLILFFGSLFAIIIMIQRKLVLLENGEAVVSNKIPFEIPHIEKVKDAVVENFKKYEHLALVMVVKSYVYIAGLLKTGWIALKTKIKERLNRNKNNQGTDGEQSANKFLKKISDYKHRIREIKHKIKEEENNL